MTFKQVIVVRKDLKMSKGKISAQVAHASSSAGMKVFNIHKEWYKIWNKSGAKKVVLECKNLQELKEIEKKAKEKNIYHVTITDAGHTELKPGTVTCIGLGPAPEKTLDKITGHLKLLD